MPVDGHRGGDRGMAEQPGHHLDRHPPARRPVKLAIPRQGGIRAPPTRPALLLAAASTLLGGAAPPAAATNNASADPARPSASASSSAVSLRAVRLMPRSRSLTDRGLSCAASASSSCVSRASARSCRSSPPKLSAACSATSQHPLRKARPGNPPPGYARPGTATSRQVPGRGQDVRHAASVAQDLPWCRGVVGDHRP